MVHTLASVVPSARPRFRCGACGELFAHRRAAQQHRLASQPCQGSSLIYIRAGEHGINAEEVSLAARSSSCSCGTGTLQEMGHPAVGETVRCSHDNTCTRDSMHSSVVRSEASSRSQIYGSDAFMDHTDSHKNTGCQGVSDLPGPVSVEGVLCDVCGLWFATHTGEQDHWEWLVPKHERWQCKGCSRTFVNERALSQHSTSCSKVVFAC